MNLVRISNNALAVKNGQTCFVVVRNAMKQYVCLEVQKVFDADFKESDHPRDKGGKFTSKGGGESGTSEKGQTEEKKYKKVEFKRVMKKLAEYKDKGAGSYSYETGEPVKKTEGYFVSFHQNEPDENGKFKSHFGKYTEDSYDQEANDFINGNKLEPVVGNYDSDPELSGWTMDREKAMELAKKYNQESIYDAELGEVILNPFYDKTKNPMRGDK